MKTDLTDRVTLVIGGTRGIGAAVVELAADAGSKVAWTGPAFEHDIEASKTLLAEMSGRGFDVMHAVVDCTDEKATVAFVTDVLSAWGRIDNLVYCAGFTSPVSFLEITAEEWRRVVDINLTGAFIAAHSVIPSMVERGNGAIVLVGSAAIHTGGGGRADYVSAKAGLEGLNLAITKEFAPKGIRCNLVHPSLIETDLLKRRHPDPAAREKLAAAVPLRRLGQPEDVAYVALFLLSDMAGYVTGQSILVDGGRTFCA
jgi:NAD(P)-dependent dehydrogenase (short-subunit alcohol dehydrogenase family)